MSTINLYEAYKTKLNKFGLNDSARFQSSFVEAVNMVYAEINGLVFLNQTLEYIGSFDDVIDERLASFAGMLFNAPFNTATRGAIYWSVTNRFVPTSSTNDIIDSFAGTSTTINAKILDGVFTLTSDGIIASATLPDANAWEITYGSNADGNFVFVNGAELELVYTEGDSSVSMEIEDSVDEARSITATSAIDGIEFVESSFLLGDSMIASWRMNENTGESLTDLINAYVITVTAPVWRTSYIAPSSGLDSQYRAIFNTALDFHLQDGGEWSIEPEPERERKWYGRGIKNARNIYRNNSTYIPPLGVD